MKYNAQTPGAKLKRLEDSIATLDHRQHKAVLETVEGVQRIRGLAGSGKTIVLALKAAYLHTQYPDWRIAVTFNTRSSKPSSSGSSPIFVLSRVVKNRDWTKIRVINAWGHPAERREMAFTMNIAVRRERRFSTLGEPLLHS